MQQKKQGDDVKKDNMEGIEMSLRLDENHMPVVTFQGFIWASNLLQNMIQTWVELFITLHFTLFCVN